MRSRYTCCSANRRYAHGEAPCALGSFYADDVDEEVWERIAALLADPRALAIAANLTNEAADADGIEAELAHLDKLVEKADRDVQETLRLWRRGRLTEAQRDLAVDETNRERGALGRSRKIVAHRLAASKKAKAMADSLEVTAERLSRRALGAGLEQRAKIIKALCPTADFGFVITREGPKAIAVSGRVCLEVAEGQVAVDLTA